MTEQAIRALVARPEPMVAILWGRDAGTLKPMLGDVPVIESAHPSPLSARRGFFGSRPFSRANRLLDELGEGRSTGGCRSEPTGIHVLLS
ncbi:uracil DNA glycosylase superfamily protein [Rhodococcus sp. MTM3W5.2]|nr:uracil DNA glycosylase superfamily protein [Rhodococcus sp. MTM3W5.2]